MSSCERKMSLADLKSIAKQCFLHACTRKVQNCNSHTASHEMDVEWRDKRRQRRSHKEWKHVLIFHVRFQEVLKEFSLTVWEKRRREWRNIRKFLLLLPLTLDCLYFFLLFVFQQAQEVTCECSLSEKGE